MKQFISGHKKQLLFTILAIVVIIAISGIAYRAGERRATAAAKAKTKATSQLFNRNGLKEAAKKAIQNKSTAPANTLKTSSGFYRLNGTLQLIGKDTITLKLTNGTNIVLATKATTNYYEGTTKLTIKDLKKNTVVTATGTVAADGTFTVTAIQKST